VESHVKSKLTELRTAYVEIEQSISDDGSARAFRSWLKDTQDSLTRFSATLTTFVIFRRMLAALWPLFIALAALGAVWNYIRDLLGKATQNDLVNVGLFAVTVAIYIITGLLVAATKNVLSSSLLFRYHISGIVTPGLQALETSPPRIYMKLKISSSPISASPSAWSGLLICMRIPLPALPPR
jgi:hypothetical protein